MTGLVNTDAPVAAVVGSDVAAPVVSTTSGPSAAASILGDIESELATIEQGLGTTFYAAKGSILNNIAKLRALL